MNAMRQRSNDNSPRRSWPQILRDVLRSAGILLAATLLGLLFEHWGFTDSNIIMVYILGVVVTSVVTSKRAYSLVSSVASVIIFNYLFTIPRFSFAAYETGYPVTFLVMFLTALITGTLAIEKEKNAREKEAAANLARSEQLRADLLRTISHDLRTPLTSISGNASNLLANGDRFDAATRRQIYTDIYEDSLWLISLVENLLSATRIEQGRMILRTETELLSDIVEEAVRHARCETHTLRVEQPEELLLVQADARLIVQVIDNLIDNAVKYTPPGCCITLTTRPAGEWAEIAVADNGPGLSDEAKQRVFDMFYSGANKIADNRRSLGLGLYLCKAIVEAHSGQICVQDNSPQGAVFRFTLPLQDVPLREV
jgi:two-component system sensor histidine kinase KdpD